MNHILLVEDSLEFQLMVKKAFGDQAYKVTVASDAKEALSLISKFDFSLIILDIGLPDQDGFELYTEFKNHPQTQNVPVIFLTGESDVSKKVTAFTLGADDFIVKPFHPLELRARVESKIKKSKENLGTEGSIWAGDLHLNVELQKIFIVEPKGEREIKLTGREFKILLFFIKNQDRVLTRNQILDSVWGDSAGVFDRTVDTNIYALRKKLGPLSEYIESVKGTGYRFSPKT